MKDYIYKAEEALDRVRDARTDNERLEHVTRALVFSLMAVAASIDRKQIGRE